MSLHLWKTNNTCALVLRKFQLLLQQKKEFYQSVSKYNTLKQILYHNRDQTVYINITIKARERQKFYLKKKLLVIGSKTLCINYLV